MVRMFAGGTSNIARFSNMCDMFSGATLFRQDISFLGCVYR
jgi:hypothetical protein